MEGWLVLLLVLQVSHHINLRSCHRLAIIPIVRYNNIHSAKGQLSCHK